MLLVAHIKLCHLEDINMDAQLITELMVVVLLSYSKSIK